MALATVRKSFHNRNVQIISELPTIDATHDTIVVYKLACGMCVPELLLALALPYCNSEKLSISTISAVSAVW